MKLMELLWSNRAAAELSDSWAKLMVNNSPSYRAGMLPARPLEGPAEARHVIRLRVTRVANKCSFILVPFLAAATNPRTRLTAQGHMTLCLSRAFGRAAGGLLRAAILRQSPGPNNGVCTHRAALSSRRG